MKKRVGYVIAFAGIAALVYWASRTPGYVNPGPVVFDAYHSIGESSSARPPVPREPAPLGNLSGEAIESAYAPYFDAEFFLGQLVGSGSVRSFTEAFLRVGYHLNATQSIGIGQEIRKLYEVAPVGNGGWESEWLLSDALIYFDQKISEDFLSLQWQGSLSATLPVSARSREAQRWTRPMATLEARRSFANQRLRVRAVPGFGYHLNRYATDMGGRPLEKMVLVGLAEATWEISPRTFSVCAWARGSYRVYEEYDGSSNSPAPTTDAAYGTHFAYEFTPEFGAQAGIAYGNSMLRDVRYDIEFYDVPAARLFGAVQIRF